METYRTIDEVKSRIKAIKSEGLSIGFVPTMGALHAGHLSLVNKAISENHITVVSIFVNPIQFNNKADLENYPRTPESDLQKLDQVGCDIVFMPDVDEMYPEPVTDRYDFGHLDKVLEGKYRPGHFNGVAVVVRKLFEIITPDRAYFGMKDYQQLKIIQTLTQSLQLPVSIIPCPTVREPDGLALSSRNIRLTPRQRQIAPAIYQVLNDLKEKALSMSVKEAEQWATNQLNRYEEMSVEYISVVNADTLLPVNDWHDAERVIVCAAVYLGDVRLIDNLMIFS